MKLEFAPKGILQIDDARIVYRNFRGEGGKYNREGDRSFSLVIPDREVADALVAEGWNVRIKPPRNEDEDEFMHLPVKVKFTDRGPNVYLKSRGSLIRLDEESVGCLDDVAIERVDLDIRPFDWEVNGKTGRTAYLHSIRITQRITDRFAMEEDYED